MSDKDRALILDEYKPSWWGKLKTKCRDKLLLDSGVGYTCLDYLMIPEKERTYFGFYKTPRAYTLDTNVSLMDHIKKNPYKIFWKAQYPVQYFFREFLRGKIRGFCNRVGWKYESFKTYFKSQNYRHNNLIPRTYMDDCDLISHMLLDLFNNFTKEMDNSMVDWKHDGVADFTKWVNTTKHKINKTLPYIQDRYYKSIKFSHAELKKPYKERLKYTRYWESLEEKLTTKICNEIIENRGHFWS